jgi:hypothetical protein
MFLLPLLLQVEKLIEETKQVTVMENRVVPETRTIQVDLDSLAS